mmetsp:Transcript_45725/g.90048  ORF Transcript_45725/g.90048 Transcript_45725/m.90048 type:complete len:422 (-) Transcript_45725:262-1527(-)
MDSGVSRFRFGSGSLVALAAVGFLSVGIHACLPALIKGKWKWKRRNETDELLQAVVREAEDAMKAQPLLRKLFAPLTEAASFEEAVALAVSRRLANGSVSVNGLFQTCAAAFSDPSPQSEERPSVGECLRRDVAAVIERDPACNTSVEVLLFYKGFAALAAHRVAHWAWAVGDTHLALWLQSRVSEVWSLDIHPAARIGAGVMFDHGTGIVIGETATIGEGCTLLHGVTLGATGKDKGDRHPKVGKFVLIGAGASILGKIHINDCAKIGSGSIVLRHVPAGATAVGIPAKIVGRATERKPSLHNDLALHDVTLIAPGPQDRRLPPDCDFRCVWREIVSNAAPLAKHIGIFDFRAALRKFSMEDNDIANLFFQLDTDNDGLVAEGDLVNFWDLVAKFCKGRGPQMEKRPQVLQDLCSLLNKQ